METHPSFLFQSMKRSVSRLTAESSSTKLYWQNIYLVKAQAVSQSVICPTLPFKIHIQLSQQWRLPVCREVGITASLYSSVDVKYKFLPVQIYCLFILYCTTIYQYIIVSSYGAISENIDTKLAYDRYNAFQEETHSRHLLSLWTQFYIILLTYSNAQLKYIRDQHSSTPLKSLKENDTESDPRSLVFFTGEKVIL